MLKKKPMRSCVVTKEKLEKKDLLRIVRNKDGIVSLDVTGKASGKGAYLKKDEEVILKARQNKILDRVLETTIPDEIYEEMLNIVNKQKEVRL